MDDDNLTIGGKPFLETTAVLVEIACLQLLQRAFQDLYQEGAVIVCLSEDIVQFRSGT